MKSFFPSLVKVLLVLWLAVGLRELPAQVFSEDFNGGIPATWTLTDVDGQTPNANVAIFTEAWIALEEAVGDSAAASTSWYTPAGQSDDWLITPAIAIPAGTYELRWKAIAQDANFPDGYEVRVSTTGTAVADFGTVLFSIAAENPVETSRTLDVSAYAGQTVHFAWRNNSSDKFILRIDDVVVDAPQIDNTAIISTSMLYPGLSGVPEKHAVLTPFSIGATLTNLGTNDLMDVRVDATIINGVSGNVLGTDSMGGPLAMVVAGDTVEFTGNNGYTPTDTGFFAAIYASGFNGTDTDPTNDTTAAVTTVTDSTFSRDVGNPSTFVTFTNNGVPVPGIFFGNNFTLATTDRVTSILVALNGPTPGDTLRAAVLAADPVTGVPQFQVATGADYVIQPTDSSSFVRLPIDQTLPPGTYCFGLVQNVTNPQILATANNFTPGEHYVGNPTTNVFFPIEDVYTGTFCFMIRPNFNFCVGLSGTTAVTPDQGNGGTATVTPSGGQGPFTYAWSDPFAQTTQTAQGLPAGMAYQVTITDSLGCTETLTTAPITDCTALSGSFSIDSVDSGTGNGSITVVPANGTPPFTYLWDDPAAQTTATATGLTGGQAYSVTITDSVGCITTLTSDTLPDCSLLDGTLNLDAPDDGSGSGSLTVTPSEGTPPYAYLWDDPAAQTTATATGLTGGQAYSVTITDSVGCTTTLTSDTLPDCSLVDATVTAEAQDDGTGTGQATLALSGATAPVLYSWNDASNQTTATATGLAAGSYTVTYTDGNGCTDSLTVDIILVGLEEMQAAGLLSFELRPNPSTGPVTVFMAFARPTGVTLEVLTLSGSRVWQAAYPAGNQLEATLPAEAWAAGTYLLRVQTKQGSFSRKWQHR
jgi:hypothetical protein